MLALIFALLNQGSVLRYGEMSNDNCVAHIPFTAFPSVYPRVLYQECLDLQPTINKLMMCIANDADFINETLGPISQVDDFTRNLLSLENTVRREGRAQSLISCINRSDYMLDKIPGHALAFDSLRIRQVEVNAIASAMSAHSQNISALQKFLLSKYNIDTPKRATFPKNESLDVVVNGLIDAYDGYGKSSAQILLIAEKRSMNFSDQIIIETEIHHRRADIKFVRRSFDQLPGCLRIGSNKELLLDDLKEIAVVYFRYGYDPTNYTFEGSWETRLLLERSRAIKCPSINFHLSGAKKFQQVLNSSEQLERYLSSDEATKLHNAFCRFWSIESEQSPGYKMVTSANESLKLVLKPQREGGGHNIFGDEIKSFVRQLADPRARSQYILMESIDSPREHNLLLTHGDEPSRESARMDNCDQLVSELGVFGSILATDSSQVISNRAGGYLVRSKKFGVNEGGVAAGYAGISSLVLFEDDPFLYYNAD